MPVPTIEPVQERILANVVTTLQGISTTSVDADYWTDVASVHCMDKTPAQTLQLPCLLVVNHGTESEPYSSTYLNSHVLSLEIFCLVSRKNENWRRDVARLAADVEKALMIDEQRGTQDGNANAFDTLIAKNLIANETDGYPTAVAQLLVQVTYRTSSKDPSVAA